MPPDGAIVVWFKTTRTGRDSSMATERGCKVQLNDKRLITYYPWMHPGRFFIPRQKWRGLGRSSPDSATIDHLMRIGAGMFFHVLVKHEWWKREGIVYRSVSVACFGPLHGEEKDVKVLYTDSYPK